MKIFQWVLVGSIGLFGAVFVLALFKGKNETQELVQEIVLVPEKKEMISLPQEIEPVLILDEKEEEEIFSIDRVNRLFAFDSSKLPIVETLTYTSRVPWLKGRPAWITDYATYHHTSRHFIARSLNRSMDYITQDIHPGDKFNVFKNDKNVEFHLVIDLSQLVMKFYYFDLDTQERVFLKAYHIGLGRKDAFRTSGYLTPTGKYKLGSKVAVYRPGVTGYFKNQKIEMVQVFGTRWLPFEEEVEECSEPCRGYGIHGSPWTLDSKGSLAEDREHIGKYDSDGCVRLNHEDIEELFAIVITKPTYVEIVHHFSEAKLPGTEKDL